MGRHHRPARYGAAITLLVATAVLLTLLGAHVGSPWADGTPHAVAVDAAPVAVHPVAPVVVAPVSVAPSPSKPVLRPAHPVAKHHVTHVRPHVTHNHASKRHHRAHHHGKHRHGHHHHHRGHRCS